ncbi:MAG: PEP-CTERM sorting domain-containing protein [Clostridiaceae bacterium]
MKKLIVVCTMILLFLGVVGYAGAATIGFEEFAPGTVVSGSGHFTDVVFSAGSIDIKAMADNPGPLFSGVMSAVSWPTHESPYRADFSISGVSSVSLVMGDYNADTDNLFVQAYNSSNTLLDQEAYTLDSAISGGPILTVTGTNIAYVIFGSTGIYPNSVFFDNFTYNASAVPEPLSMVLLGFGLLGIAGMRRKLKK